MNNTEKLKSSFKKITIQLNTSYQHKISEISGSVTKTKA